MTYPAGAAAVFSTTDVDPRPVIHVILGKHLKDGEYIVRVGDPLTLEQAEGFVALGWEAIVDPQDMEAFTRWEQIQRSQREPRSWRRWSGRD